MQIKKESEQGKILSLRLDYVHCYKLCKTVSIISLNVSTPSTVYILFVLSIVLNLLPLLAQGQSVHARAIRGNFIYIKNRRYPISSSIFISSQPLSSEDTSQSGLKSFITSVQGHIFWHHDLRCDRQATCWFLISHITNEYSRFSDGHEHLFVRDKISAQGKSCRR